MEICLLECVSGLKDMPMFQVFWNGKEEALKKCKKLIQRMIDENFPEDQNGFCFIDVLETKDLNEKETIKYKNTEFWEDHDLMERFNELHRFIFWKPTEKQVGQLKEILVQEELPKEVSFKGPNNRNRVILKR